MPKKNKASKAKVKVKIKGSPGAVRKALKTLAGHRGEGFGKI